MIYNVTNDFTQLSVTSGTIQNNSSIFTVEVSDKAVEGSGILLLPLNKYTFHNTNLFVRCVEAGGWAEIRIVPFEVDVGNVVSGGGSYTDFNLESFTQKDVEDIFR